MNYRQNLAKVVKQNTDSVDKDDSAITPDGSVVGTFIALHYLHSFPAKIRLDDILL